MRNRFSCLPPRDNLNSLHLNGDIEVQFDNTVLWVYYLNSLHNYAYKLAHYSPLQYISVFFLVVEKAVLYFEIDVFTSKLANRRGGH